MYNLNTNLWPFTTPNVRTTCRIWKIITFLEFLSQGRRSDILLNKIQALLIFDPLITLWGHFKAPYFKMLNDARVASTWLDVRTCQRVRNIKNIATICDFQLYIRVNSTMRISRGISARVCSTSLLSEQQKRNLMWWRSGQEAMMTHPGMGGGKKWKWRPCQKLTLLIQFWMQKTF